MEGDESVWKWRLNLHQRHGLCLQPPPFPTMRQLPGARCCTYRDPVAEVGRERMREVEEEVRRMVFEMHG